MDFMKQHHHGGQPFQISRDPLANWGDPNTKECEDASIIQLIDALRDVQRQVKTKYAEKNPTRSQNDEDDASEENETEVQYSEK